MAQPRVIFYIGDDKTDETILNMQSPCIKDKDDANANTKGLKENANANTKGLKENENNLEYPIQSNIQNITTNIKYNKSFINLVLDILFKIF